MEPIFCGQKVKSEGQKGQNWRSWVTKTLLRGSLHCCECWLLLVWCFLFVCYFIYIFIYLFLFIM